VRIDPRSLKGLGQGFGLGQPSQLSPPVAMPGTPQLQPKALAPPVPIPGGQVMPVPDSADAGTEEPDAGEPEDTTGLKGLPAAEPISFKAVLQKAQVTLGEPFVLAIEVRHSPKETYAMPPHLDLGDFGVRDHKLEEHGDDPKVTVLRLTLQAFSTGDKTIPTIRLAVDEPSGPHQLEIPSQKIKVTGVIDDSQGPPQMKEDRKPLLTRYHWVVWPLWLLLCAVVGAITAFVLRHRKARAAAAKPARPRLPAFEEAMERLHALEAENLIAKGERQPYYFRLSEIVRDFVGRRYGFESLEMTTNELLLTLRQRATPGLDYDGLAQFLRESDFVKFARRDPSDGECKTALDVARTIILRARPPLEQPVEARTA
jgi:hypothetical protein